MKKITLYSIIISLSVFCFTTALTLAASSAPSFQPLENSVPWLDDIKSSGNLTSLFSTIFNVVIAIAAVLAVIQIMWGGIQYMTVDAWSMKSDAKDRINNAIIGLIIALVSWLILYTINPTILDLSFIK